MSQLSTKITFTEEQTMLLDTATAFFREKSPTATVRRQIASESGVDRELWSEIAELGWLGIAVPERFGGSGLSLADVTVIVEPMGRHLAGTPFVSTQLFTQALLAGGSDQQQRDILPKICGGSIGSVALFESDGDWNLDHLECAAVIAGDAARLSGTKTLVCDAAVADFVLASVSLDGAPALAIVKAADLPRKTRETVIDETRRAFSLDLNGVNVPVSSLITGEKARAALKAIRDCALLLASAEAAGGIAGALDVIVEYLNTRTAFGRKIGSYQSLKHTCSEILVGLERARSHVYHAASLVAAGEDAEVALRMAKVEAGDTFVFAGDRAIQFHGGFGFTYDCDAQLYLRRALWLQYAFGDAAHHRRRLADLLLPPG
ncbi:acyl-CoA dehydrogenase [Bradyrhizobium sp. KBS0727]|jgi:acyl-CoA dehydrogenase|uniref:acyl-CoA dehydrogenase family protein n=1 Tax=unclassified Bradyrhizobium TaxID=2631580 RepID=UPI00110E2333|nr:MULTISPECIES: acyl-CoA dehydrogenase family protein [unclassified Bradyrhizobium]QDW41680.1 acyl-CoA dehydrogenase [Bradyrhizobium sp. KBS0725]QDW48288.1 acyl-CoA dehydrogenase [Bradyrhizobium sp. KBS0727]